MWRKRTERRSARGAEGKNTMQVNNRRCQRGMWGAEGEKVSEKLISNNCSRSSGDKYIYPMQLKLDSVGITTGLTTIYRHGRCLQGRCCLNVQQAGLRLEEMPGELMASFNKTSAAERKKKHFSQDTAPSELNKSKNQIARRRHGWWQRHLLPPCELCVSVCMCWRERERKRERGRKRESVQRLFTV